jgi:nitroimidazol reductase NimA-like FMN-containing flavoprotein (pyridoxamine 5'-phosphate oxidase superfamily)
MIDKGPTAELDSQFSTDDATQIPWAEGRERLEGAEVYWISTVRPDGWPHVTPLLSIWLDDALYFCTGPHERKAKNLGRNPHCILTTGCSTLDGASTWWPKARW